MKTFIQSHKANIETIFDIKNSNKLVIVCHPNTIEGGNFSSKVVYIAIKAAKELGLSSIKFNFRGAGNSSGVYSNGVNEKEDLKAVIQYAKKFSKEVILIGFSFGAYIVSEVSCDYGILNPCLIAPAINKWIFNKEIIKFNPFIIYGESDQIIGKNQIEFFFKKTNKLMVLEASHFFDGKLKNLYAGIYKYLEEQIRFVK
jgi:alpha/beta superfamily hydrolase